MCRLIFLFQNTSRCWWFKPPKKASKTDKMCRSNCSQRLSRFDMNFITFKQQLRLGITLCMEMRKPVEIYDGIQWVWLHSDRYALCFMAPAIIPWLYENLLLFALKTRIPNIITVCSGVALWFYFYEMQFLQTRSNKRTNAHKLCRKNTTATFNEQATAEDWTLPISHWFSFCAEGSFFSMSIVHREDDCLLISMPISMISLRVFFTFIYLYTCRVQCDMPHQNRFNNLFIKTANN